MNEPVLSAESLGRRFHEGDIDVTVLQGVDLHIHAGETLAVGPFKVIVERVVRRKIERVYFERVTPLDPDAGES